MAKTDDEQPQALRLSSRCPPWFASSFQHLLNRHRQGRLPHALLLSGAAEVGKRWFAEHLVKALLCRADTNSVPSIPCGQCASCAQLQSGSSSEFRYLTPAGKSMTIRIDPVRELVDWLQLSASAGRYRIALITGADSMNRAAANALLKTLEEPAANSLCILVADKPALLPATIMSRCQKMVLSIEEPQQAVDWLQPQLSTNVSAGAALDAARGAPLRALRETQPEWQSQRAVIDAAWWNLLLHKRSVGAIVESLKDVPLESCLSRFMALCADAARVQVGASALASAEPLSEEQRAAHQRLKSEQWFTIHDQLLNLYRIDSASFKTQTVLEGFLADTRLKLNG